MRERRRDRETDIDRVTERRRQKETATKRNRDEKRQIGCRYLFCVCIQDFESLLGHHARDRLSTVETRLFCLRLLCVALEAGN